MLSFCPFSSSPYCILLSFSPPYYPGPGPYTSSSFFPVPLQVSYYLPFMYLSLFSLLTPRQIIFISFDSLECIQIYITTYVFIDLLSFSLFHSALDDNSSPFLQFRNHLVFPYFKSKIRKKASTLGKDGKILSYSKRIRLSSDAILHMSQIECK